MFGPFKRLFGGGRTGERDFSAVSSWAERRGLVFRRARGDAGFVIEGELESRPWRLEWGPSQRAYIDGQELRVRMELGLPHDQQTLLLSRPLMDALERRTYEHFVDGVQTEAGSGTPEEMRWLVMLQKLDMSTLRGLGIRFGAVASQPAVGLAWIAGPLANLLLHEGQDGLLKDDPPLVLMTLRGRAYLRLGLGPVAPAPSDLGAALGLFETAVAQAVRVSTEVTDSSAGWTTSATSAWHSLQPGDDAGSRRGR